MFATSTGWSLDSNLKQFRYIYLWHSRHAVVSTANELNLSDYYQIILEQVKSNNNMDLNTPWSCSYNAFSKLLLCLYSETEF